MPGIDTRGTYGELLFLFLVIFTSQDNCGCEGKPLPEVLSIVNGVKITARDFDPATESRISELKRQVIDARRRELDLQIKNPIFKSVSSVVRVLLLAQSVRNFALCSKGVPPSSVEICPAPLITNPPVRLLPSARSPLLDGTVSARIRGAERGFTSSKSNLDHTR